MTTPIKRGRASAANAGPTQMAVTLKGEAPQYSNAAALATVTPFKSKRLSRQRLALIRISELIRLANFYRRMGIRVDADLFLFALAVALACVRPGTKILKGRAIPQHGLDILTLQDAAQCANLGNFSDDELWTKIEAVRRYHAKNGFSHLSAKFLGDGLQLTSAERAECSITTIDAVDEPKTERQARKAAEKKVRDQTYNRTQRGRRPQAFRDAEAETRRRLCEEHGITERTLRRWERAGKVDVRLATSYHIESLRRASPTGHGAEQEADAGAADSFGTPNPSRGVNGRGCRGTELSEPASEIFERSEIDSYGSGSSAARSRGRDASRMSPGKSAVQSRSPTASRMLNSEAPVATFDPSETIAALIEAEDVLSDIAAKSRGADIERFEKLSASVGMFRLLLEVSTVSQPDDGAEILSIGIDHIAPRLRAANDNRLSILAKRLAA